MLESILSPSTAMRELWLGLTALRETFASTEKSGKWLVRPPETIDKAWIEVLALVSTGAVICAKVSTHQGVRFGGYAGHVICVYTRNWRARKDVMRVREVLRSVGFTERLRYKRDIETVRGLERFTYEA